MKKTILGLALLSLFTCTSAIAAYETGDFVIRGGATMVSPDSGKSGVYVEALGGDTPLSVSVDDDTQLGLNFVYFYDSNWAVEVLAATPFKHDVKVHDPEGISGADGLFGVDVDGITLGDVTHLPPTVSALYYFDTSSKLQPYVGVGLNYTIFFDEEFKSAPKSVGFNSLKLESSLGIALQVGADYEIDDTWHVNASVRYIDLQTDADFKIGDLKGTAKIDIDPMVYSLMLGYKF